MLLHNIEITHYKWKEIIHGEIRNNWGHTFNMGTQHGSKLEAGNFLINVYVMAL